MKTRFVCLANSFKEGGRCIAGIELDKNHNPIILNGKPKWVRPIYSADHGQIPGYIAESFQILNIIEIDITEIRPEGYQSENVTFRENSLKNIGNFDLSKLDTLCEKIGLIFGNKGKAVHNDSIGNLSHSLILVNVSQFEIKQIIYEDNPDRPKTRMVFEFNGSRYDLPITDPYFLQKYQANSKVLENVDKVYLTLSLGIPLSEWYYKLVAGVIC